MPESHGCSQQIWACFLTAQSACPAEMRCCRQHNLSMIKTKTSDESPRLHSRKIDFTREYFDFCYSHAAAEGEIHHLIPKSILEKRIANKMTVRLSPVDHMTAHWLLTLSLYQRGKVDIAIQIGYAKPFIAADAEYKRNILSHVRFAAKDTNEWRTITEIYNDIVIPTCHKCKAAIPTFECFERKFLIRAFLCKNHFYFRDWKICVC